MDHPLDLTDEAPAAIDQTDAPTTIQAISARLRHRYKAVEQAARDGATADFPSPAPVADEAAIPMMNRARALAAHFGVRASRLPLRYRE